MRHIKSMNELCRALSVSVLGWDRATQMTNYYSREDALKILDQCSQSPRLERMRGAFLKLKKVRCINLIDDDHFRLL